jgi:hypothetical protein
LDDSDFQAARGGGGRVALESHFMSPRPAQLEKLFDSEMFEMMVSKISGMMVLWIVVCALLKPLHANEEETSDDGIFPAQPSSLRLAESQEYFDWFQYMTYSLTCRIFCRDMRFCC